MKIKPGQMYATTTFDREHLYNDPWPNNNCRTGTIDVHALGIALTSSECDSITSMVLLLVGTRVGWCFTRFLMRADK